MTGIRNHSYETYERDDNNKINLISKEIQIHECDLLKNLELHGEDFLAHGPIDLIEKLLYQHIDEIHTTRYLNNFDLAIKQAVKKEFAPIMREIDPETHRCGVDLNEENTIRHSEKFMTQTFIEFRKDIEKAIIACGINKEELKDIFNARQKRINDGNKAEERRKHIYKKIRPIYIQLRKQGYTNADLIV
ncbi:MAG: hypothetical protein WC010_00185 [Candidatus Absconditabacterales bacterium]